MQLSASATNVDVDRDLQFTAKSRVVVIKLVFFLKIYQSRLVLVARRRPTHFKCNRVMVRGREGSVVGHVDQARCYIRGVIEALIQARPAKLSRRSVAIL